MTIEQVRQYSAHVTLRRQSPQHSFSFSSILSSPSSLLFLTQVLTRGECSEWYRNFLFSTLWRVKSLHYLLFTLETSLTRLRATLTYGYKHKHLGHSSITCPFSKTAGVGAHHQSSPWISEPWAFDQIYYTGHVFSLVEQASDPIRKWLATLFPPSCLHSTFCHYES